MCALFGSAWCHREMPMQNMARRLFSPMKRCISYDQPGNESRTANIPDLAGSKRLLENFVWIWRFWSSMIKRRAIWWVNRHFGGKYHRHLQGRSVSQEVVFLSTYSSTLKMLATCSSETSVDFNDIISRKTELFLTTAERTPHPKLFESDCGWWVR
jgi:hypothetical protein